MSELRPTAGARFVLELREARGASALYRASIYVPDGEQACDATLGDDGAVELGDGIAAGELRDKLAVIAKVLARGAPGRRESGEKAWPARVMRWRGPK